jgi:hypothetical protein
MKVTNKDFVKLAVTLIEENLEDLQKSKLELRKDGINNYGIRVTNTIVPKTEIGLRRLHNASASKTNFDVTFGTMVETEFGVMPIKARVLRNFRGISFEGFLTSEVLDLEKLLERFKQVVSE